MMRYSVLLGLVLYSAEASCQPPGHQIGTLELQDGYYASEGESSLLLLGAGRSVLMIYQCGWRQGRGGHAEDSYQVLCPYYAAAKTDSPAKPPLDFSGPQLKATLELETAPEAEGTAATLRLRQKAYCEGVDISKVCGNDVDLLPIPGPLQKTAFKHCVVSAEKSFFHDFLHTDKPTKDYVIKGDIVEATLHGNYIGKREFILSRYLKTVGWLAAADMRCRD